jgi:hypothetical protein
MKVFFYAKIIWLLMDIYKIYFTAGLLVLYGSRQVTLMGWHACDASTGADLVTTLRNKFRIPRK